MSDLTQEDFNYLTKKYDKLILYTANRITGDLARDVEDYYQEIWCLIISDLPRYLAKTGLNVVDFCTHPQYSKFIKQWIWTYKNRVGASITAKKDLLSIAFRIGADNGNDTDNLEQEISFELQDTNAPYIGPMLAELKEGRSTKDLVLSAIAFDPDTVTDTGKFNRSAILEKTGLTRAQIGRVITEINNEHKNTIKSHE